MVKAPREAHSHGDLGKLFRTGLLLLALVLQGYLSQVHHHDFAASRLAVAAAGNTTDAPVPPVDSDGRDHHCFICHLSGLGSASVAPPSIVFTTVPAGLVVYRFAHDLLEAHDAPPAYSSRAPPSLLVQA